MRNDKRPETGAKSCEDQHRWMKSDAPYDLLGQIERLHYARRYDSLMKAGLYPGQPPVLFVLSRQEGLTQRELAKELHLTPATVNVMLKRMEHAGLVERRGDSRDLRLSRVFLTDKGRETDESMREAGQSMRELCFRDMSEEEVATLQGLLIRVRTNLQDGLAPDRIETDHRRKTKSR